MMKSLIKRLHEEKCSCVIANGNETRVFFGRGVSDVYDLLKNEPEFLKNASVADKVIGKGAAALMVQGGVKEVYTDLLSEQALSLFTESGISVQYKELVHHIINRDKTDWCPLEKRCVSISSVEEIIPVIDKFILEIKGSAIILLFLVSLFSNTIFAQDTIRILPEIVVTGTRNKLDIRHLPLSVSIVNREKIENSIESSLLPILMEQVPGLFITDRGIMGYGVSTGASGGMSMRGIGGSPTTGMLVLIDGHPQYMGLMGHPIADAYQSMLAEKVEIVRGSGSVLYGSNAMGGVINIITKKMEKDTIYHNMQVSYGSFNTLTTEAQSRFRRKNFSSVVTGSYNRTDGHRERMGFEQYGGYAKLGYEFSKQWNVFADANITHFNASNPGMENKPIYDNSSKITRGMSSLSIENEYALTSGAFKFFYNWGKHNINDGYFENEAPKNYFFNSNDLMLGITCYQSASLFAGNRLTVGFDYQEFGGKAWNSYNDGSKTDIIDRTEKEIAEYIDFRQNINSIMTLDAGVRFDYHTQTGSQWIPQFGASIYPFRIGEIKLIAGKGFRNPTIRELYMFPPQNANLHAESLWNYELAWSHRMLKNRLSYGVSLFYINAENMIQTVMIDGRPINMNSNEFENFGIEISANYHISKALSMNANYSWLHMEKQIIAAPEHKLYAGLDYMKGRWTMSSGLQYVDGLYVATHPTIFTENFVLWNAGCTFKANKKIKLFVKAENLLNQKYEINLGFPMPGTSVVGGLNINI